MEGHLDVVKFLIEDMKYHPQIPNNFGDTPLHHAIKNGHRNIVKYLVNTHHCDPLSINNPLKLATKSDKTAIVSPRVSVYNSENTIVQREFSGVHDYTPILEAFKAI